MSTRVPSDNLLHLRELFLTWQPFFRLLEVLPQFRLVIDTNVVIEELLYLNQNLQHWDTHATFNCWAAINSPNAASTSGV